MLKSYLDSKFDVLDAASDNRYADGNNKRLANSRQSALFSSYKLTTSSRKLLEDIGHAHTVSLMYKLKTSAGVSDDVSIGFDRDRGKRQRE